MTHLVRKTIALALLVGMLLFSTACVEDRNTELLQKIEQLEQRVTELEAKPAKPDYGPRRRTPLKDQHFTKFDEIETVWWDGQMHYMTYQGQLDVHESTIAPTDNSLDGLMFHPNGRIAYSKGGGSSPDMRIAYLRASAQDNIVDLKYASRRDPQKDPDFTEENGYFWFFDGPAALDANGTCFFSLGSCSPNSMYKVISNNPTRLERLYPLQYSTRSLQIVPFDADVLYSTSHDGIYRLPQTRQEEANATPWFKVNCRNAMLSHTLVISPTKLIAAVLFRKPSPDDKSKYDQKTLLFDRLSQSYWSLSIDKIGPMAISWDGHRKIRYNYKPCEIREFQIEVPTATGSKSELRSERF